MEEFKGTPGKWINVGGWVDAEKGGSICYVSRKPGDIDEANANLMAAAPELLDALQLLLKQAENRATTTYPEWYGAVKKARSAIAKALGK
ncbi:hypothetical protein [Pseudescherichia sp.]|uniref:hypothetical protein n=1 Tax=Pseudescherichia sp. TaxID=2055881 RepID=UPI002898DDF8|nr:hypothetical protein [Pseudescherichia sp.]